MAVNPPPHVGADPSPTREVAEGLWGLARLIESTHARVCHAHELTPVQGKLLSILLTSPRGMGDLARCLGIEKAALTGLIDRAEGRGLVQRETVPGDRRATNVALTTAGRKAARAFYAEVTTDLADLLSPLSPGDRDRFTRLLAQLIAAAPADQCLLSLDSQVAS